LGGFEKRLLASIHRKEQQGNPSLLFFVKSFSAKKKTLDLTPNCNDTLHYERRSVRT